MYDFDKISWSRLEVFQLLEWNSRWPLPKSRTLQPAVCRGPVTVLATYAMTAQAHFLLGRVNLPEASREESSRSLFYN